MNIKGKAAVVTGAASGIGQAIAVELAERGIRAVALVDCSDGVLNIARVINDRMDRPVADAFIGDVTDTAFRRTCSIRCAASTGCRPSAFPPQASPGTSLPSRWTSRPASRAVPDRALSPGDGGQPGCPGVLGDRDVARIAEERPRKGKGRWAADGRDPGNRHLHRLDLIARHPRPDLVTRAPRQPSREPPPRCARRPSTTGCASPPSIPDSPTPRWSAAGPGVHREEHSSLHPAQAADRPEPRSPMRFTS